MKSPKPRRRPRPPAPHAARPRTLDRLLSKSGVGSRTEAQALVRAGRVKVNGRVVRDPEAWADPAKDRVTFDGRPLEAPEPVYLALYKPKGVVTTARDPQGRRTVFDLLPERDRHLFSVGRLDLDSSGLLLLTNDSQFAEKLMNPGFHVPKTYQVKASGHLDDGQLERLRLGLELDDGPTRPARVERLREPGGRTVFRITITEGRNRQVRRMVEAVGGKVLELVRVAIGPLRLGELTPGRFRALQTSEVRALLASARSVT